MGTKPPFWELLIAGDNACSLRFLKGQTEERGQKMLKRKKLNRRISTGTAVPPPHLSYCSNCPRSSVGEENGFFGKLITQLRCFAQQW
jgi:hypothetical protein